MRCSSCSFNAERGERNSWFAVGRSWFAIGLQLVCSGHAPLLLDRLVIALPKVDYDTFVNASKNVPSYLSYNYLAFNYAPRQDGGALTDSPEVLAETGKYAAVPMIIGNQ